MNISSPHIPRGISVDGGDCCPLLLSVRLLELIELDTAGSKNVWGAQTQ
jgi:hypothetical protein